MVQFLLGYVPLFGVLIFLVVTYARIGVRNVCHALPPNDLICFGWPTVVAPQDFQGSPRR